MIDLHMHTTYSDGTDSVKKLLKKANKANLEIISITDHNTCASYKKMKKLNVSKFYQGNILVGCEFTTSFDNRLIEVLGYGLDYQKIQKNINTYYNNNFEKKEKTILLNRLIKIITDLGLKFNLKKLRRELFRKNLFEVKIYKELVKYPENKEILKEDVWNSFSDFYRKGLTNQKSKLFINHAEFKPQLKDVINLIHEAGGLAFLAHPFQYKFNDTKIFLNKIYREYNLDGIECFYTTFTEEQTTYIKEFAEKNNLYISGGSDYHGKNKINHELGIGRGNLNINKNIISNWNIKYYPEN